MDDELSRRIAERRADPDFKARLDRLMDENREALDRLGGGEPEREAEIKKLMDDYGIPRGEAEFRVGLERGEHDGDVIAVDAWTAEQEEMWQLCRAGKPPVPSGDQTPQQAFNFAVGGFMRACDFEGVEPPSQEIVERRFRDEFGEPPPKL